MRGWTGLYILTLFGALALACAPAATPTPTPEAPKPSPLLRVLKKMPPSFKEEGIWFGDRARALKLAGFTKPLSFEEMRALEEGQRKAYLEAMAGIVFDSGLMAMAQRREWEETFGFSGSDLSLAVSTGGFSGEPLAAAYLEGEFDEEAVRQRLQELGYEERVAAGRTYYTIRGDREVDPTHPGGRLAMARMNRVFVGEGVLIRAPATHQITGILEAWAGLTPSLADDPAFSSLAVALGDPLSAVLLTRSSVLEIERVRPPPELKKQAGWGMLHEWEALGVGYGIAAGGERWWAFSLYYPEPGAAEADGEEMVQRMQSYAIVSPSLRRAGFPEHPFKEFCASLSWNAKRRPAGSTLTVRCTLTEGARAGMWLMLVDSRDLGFLVP
jgi:hypothetical protein